MSDDEESLFEVTVTVSYTETFDLERASKEEARETGVFYVQDDISQGVIDIDAFDINATATEVVE